MAIMVPAIAGKIINIGRAGENLATTVVFDVSDWVKSAEEGGFGNNGTFTLTIQQGGGSFYSQDNIDTSEAGKVKWPINNVNTSVVGLGKCELNYRVIDNEETIVIKSIIYDFVVTNSLDMEATGNVPDVVVSWLDQIGDILTEATSAQAWATGERGDQPVGPSEPQYHNNALYYSGLAQSAESTATQKASDASGYANDASGYANNASDYATAAANSAAEIEDLDVTAITGSPLSTASVTKTKPNDYLLTFTIPRGSGWFSGNVNPTTVSNAKNNDYYLNTTDGSVWRCTNDNGNSWNEVGNIKGKGLEVIQVVTSLPTSFKTQGSIYGLKSSLSAATPADLYLQNNASGSNDWVYIGREGGISAYLYDWTSNS